MVDLGWTEVDLAAVPSTISLYRKAVLHRGTGGDTIPVDRLQLADQPIDAERLWRYQRLCGYRVSDVLPPTYLHLLTFPLGLALMTRPEFPFPVLGLIHVRNEITQDRPVRADERVTVRTWAANLRPRASGRVIDLVSEVLVGDEPVWQEMSSYLHRHRAGDSKPATPGIMESEPKAPAEQPPGPVVRWEAAAEIGRRYAAVSGDRNPIHLSGLSAKAFGFRAAIAHGMWLKARTLAAFEGRLPERLSVQVAFKTPVLLPSTVELQATPRERYWQFQVRGVRSGKPHLTGTIVAVNKDSDHVLTAS
jgi:acyl dehydratase